jgi:ribosomal protein L14E/L6E/L27E
LYRIKSGKVVVVLAGRFAGRKAVVVKASDEGNEIKKFGHALGNLRSFIYFHYVFATIE